MKESARYITLSILGQLGISCYIIADTFFISKGFGANGLIALNLAILIYNFIFHQYSGYRYIVFIKIILPLMK